MVLSESFAKEMDSPLGYCPRMKNCHGLRHDMPQVQSSIGISSKRETES